MDLNSEDLKLFGRMSDEIGARVKRIFEEEVARGTISGFDRLQHWWVSAGTLVIQHGDYDDDYFVIEVPLERLLEG
jgi:hypothetical protein